MALTIYDIAKKAKVGIGTVSRALNNHPSISPSTRNHILAIANKCNYHPNTSAQRLARKKSKAISVIVPFFTNYFFAQMLHGIQDKIREIDYDLVLYGVNHVEQASTHLMRTLKAGHIDGVLYISMDLPEDFIERGKLFKTPVILVDRYHSDFPSLTVENVKGAFTATSHLLKLGHRRIALINGDPKSVPAREREVGYKNALKKFGLINPPLIVTPKQHLKEDGFNKDAGYEAAMEILSMGRHKHPTAIFVASDVQAIGVLQALREKNFRVPQDMAIIGFDDIDLAKNLGLSTMHQPIYDMGVLGVQRLLERLDNPQKPPCHEKFEPTLIIRDSCGGKLNGMPST